MNVVQLTLTRETASWLARQDQRDDQGHPAVTPAGAGRGGAWSADESYVRAPSRGKILNWSGLFFLSLDTTSFYDISCITPAFLCLFAPH